MAAESPVTLGHWLDLREEMRAAELLLQEMQFAPGDLRTFWELSAELLTLLEEVEAHLEQWRLQGPVADEASVYLAMRRRLVALLARSEQIARPAEPMAELDEE